MEEFFTRREFEGLRNDEETVREREREERERRERER